MISISTLRSKWRCNSCKAPNQNNKYILVTVGEENNILCRDCAETLGIMLLDHVREKEPQDTFSRAMLRELEKIEEYKRAKEDDWHE